MTLGAAYGLIGASLLVAFAALPVLRRLPLATRGRAVALAALLAAAWIPAQGIPVTGYFRGVFGDPSVVTLGLVGAALVAHLRGTRLSDRRECAIGFGAVLALAAFLYPMSLGLGDFDPYVLGYGSESGATALAAVFAALGWAAWFARLTWILWLLLAAIACHLGGITESANLWDVLLDPLLAGYALWWWLRVLSARMRGTAPARDLPRSGA